MAFLFVDGFDSFGTTPGNAPVGLLNKYVENFGLNHTNDTVQAGRWNGFSLRPRASSGSTAGAEINLVTQYATLVCGFAFRLSALPATVRELVNFMTSSGGEVGVTVLPTGKIRVNRNSPTSEIIQDSTLSDLVRPNRWYYLEFKATIANSGSFDVYLDGVQVAFAANTGDTQTTNAFATIVRLVGRGSTGNNLVDVDFDDFYILDTTGSPNDFLGPRHMYTVFPDGAGDDTELTPNTGNNHQAVDDNGHDTDTTYIATTTDLAQDLYTFANVTGASDIDVVAVYALARKTDVTSFNVICMTKSNGTEDEGDSKLVNTQTYNAFGAFFIEDPDTTDPWTQSGVNAAQFGLKVEA